VGNLLLLESIRLSFFKELLSDVIGSLNYVAALLSAFRLHYMYAMKSNLPYHSAPF
jgi:hypothetical protein